MTKREECELNRGGGVVVFVGEHPVTPPIPRVGVLIGSISSLIEQANTEGGNQAGGRGDFLGGSAHRRQLATALHSRLREIGQTASSLPQDQYPGTKEQFRVAARLRYQQIIDVGNAFLDAIGPIKAAFVERAYPADFDETLAAQIDAFETATERKARGKQLRRTGTAGLKQTLPKLKEAIDELDAILSVHYKATNPTLLEVWKNAKRVENPAYLPRKPTSPPAGGGDGGGSGGGSALVLGSPAASELNSAGAAIASVESRSNGASGVLVS
jgi:hypothetical protein